MVENKLGTEKINKLIFKLALPAIVAQLINIVYNLVDRIYIGHIHGIGSTALTGVGVTLPIIMTITAFAYLCAMGSAPSSAIKMGENDYEYAEKILGNSATSMLIISIILTIVYFVFGDTLLWWFGASSDTISYASIYLKIYVLGTVFVQVSVGLNAFITAQGMSIKSMSTVLIGAILNIILDPIFIFGFNLGVAGAALATILSQCVSSIWVLKFLTSKKSMIRLKIKNLRLEKRIILPCLTLGLAPFIMNFTESALFISFNTSLLKYGGDIAVGAMTILMSLLQFQNIFIQGLMTGCQPIISYSYGAKNIERMKEAIKKLLIIGFLFTGITWLAYMLVPSVFIRMFTSDKSLIDFASWALRIYLSASAFFSLQIVCQQCFVGVGNAKTSIFIACLRKLILLIPLIYILPNFFEDKLFAVYLAEPVSDMISVITTVTLFTLYFNKLLRILGRKNMLEVGNKAPDFELEDVNGNKVKLSDFKGKKVLIYIYPKDNTAGCTAQACNYRDRYDEFADKNTVIIGVSKDSVKSHIKFIDKYNLPFILLSDPEHKMIEDYGSWQLKKLYGKEYMGVVRSTFLVDEEGTLLYVNYKPKAKSDADDTLTKMD